MIDREKEYETCSRNKHVVTLMTPTSQETTPTAMTGLTTAANNSNHIHPMNIPTFSDEEVGGGCGAVKNMALSGTQQVLGSGVLGTTSQCGERERGTEEAKVMQCEHGKQKMSVQEMSDSYSPDNPHSPSLHSLQSPSHTVTCPTLPPSQPQQPWFSLTPRQPCETPPIITLTQQQPNGGWSQVTSSASQQYTMTTAGTAPPMPQYAYVTPSQPVLQQVGIGYTLVGNTLVPQAQYISVSPSQQVQYVVANQQGVQYVVQQPQGMQYVSLGGNQVAVMPTAGALGVVDGQQLILAAAQGQEQTYQVISSDGLVLSNVPGEAANQITPGASTPIVVGSEKKTEDIGTVYVEQLKPEETGTYRDSQTPPRLPDSTGDNLLQDSTAKQEVDEEDEPNTLYSSLPHSTISTVAMVGQEAVASALKAAEKLQMEQEEMMQSPSHLKKSNSMRTSADGIHPPKLSESEEIHTMVNPSLQPSTQVGSDHASSAVAPPQTQNTRGTEEYITVVLPASTPGSQQQYLSLPADPRVVSGQCSYAVLQQPDGSSHIVMVDNSTLG